MKNVLKTLMLTVLILLGCQDANQKVNQRKQLAEKYLRSVYGGEGTQLETFAHENIVVTYPAFEEILKVQAIKGRDEVKQFAIGFSKRWEGENIQINETIGEGDKVFLLWSFSAKKSNTLGIDSMDVDKVYSWGGISMIQFDEANKIVAEIGEESTPGPYARWELSKKHK